MTSERPTSKGSLGAIRTPEDQDALDLAADWADIIQGLKKDLGQQLFAQWIRPIQLGSFAKDTGTLDLAPLVVFFAIIALKMVVQRNFPIYG